MWHQGFNRHFTKLREWEYFLYAKKTITTLLNNLSSPRHPSALLENIRWTQTAYALLCQLRNADTLFSFKSKRKQQRVSSRPQVAKIECICLLVLFLTVVFVSFVVHVPRLSQKSTESLMAWLGSVSSHYPSYTGLYSSFPGWISVEVIFLAKAKR